MTDHLCHGWKSCPICRADIPEDVREALVPVTMRQEQEAWHDDPPDLNGPLEGTGFFYRRYRAVAARATAVLRRCRRAGGDAELERAVEVLRSGDRRLLYRALNFL